MSKADLGYTIVYVGPEKIEFPPKMSNVCKGISKTELRAKMLKLQEGQILSIPVENGGKKLKEERPVENGGKKLKEERDEI